MKMLARCLVCGVEDDEIDPDIARREANGEPAPNDNSLAYYFADGRVVTSCDTHAAGQVRAAFVLTEPTLTLESLR